MKPTSESAKAFAAAFKTNMVEKFSGPDAKQIPSPPGKKTYDALTRKGRKSKP